MRRIELFCSLILVLLLLALSTVLARDHFLGRIHRLEKIWKSDWRYISSQPEFSKYLNNISDVQIEAPAADELAQVWQKNIHKPFCRKKDGQYIAQILLVSEPNEDSLFALIQLDLVDKKTGNTVLEIARRYPLSKAKSASANPAQ